VIEEVGLIAHLDALAFSGRVHLEPLRPVHGELNEILDAAEPQILHLVEIEEPQVATPLLAHVSPPRAARAIEGVCQEVHTDLWNARVPVAVEYVIPLLIEFEPGPTPRVGRLPARPELAVLLPDFVQRFIEGQAVVDLAQDRLAQRLD